MACPPSRSYGHMVRRRPGASKHTQCRQPPPLPAAARCTPGRVSVGAGGAGQGSIVAAGGEGRPACKATAHLAGQTDQEGRMAPPRPPAAPQKQP